MRYRGRLIAPLMIAAASAAWGQDIPPALTPNSASPLLFQARATGVQIYVCSASDDALHWTLKAPEADLVNADGTAFAHHFIGPTWAATDGSKVVGALVAKVASPQPHTIPWLLLSAKPGATGRFAAIRFIQRVDTQGGAAPNDACPAEGRELRVPYTAIYNFRG